MFIELASWHISPANSKARISSAPVIVVGNDYAVLGCNEASRLLCQKAWRKEIVVGMNLTSLIPGPLQSTFQAHFQQALGGLLVSSILPLDIADSSPLLFRILYHPQFDGDGATTNVAISLTLVESERAARGAGEIDPLLQEMVDNSSELISILDDEGTILYQNNSCERLLNAPASSLIGRRFTDSVLPEDFPRVNAVIEAIARDNGAANEITCRMRRRDGAVIWTDSKFKNLLHQPGVQGILVHTRDITRERIHGEEAREADRRYRSIFENAVEGIFQSSPDGRLVNANIALARILGFETSEGLIDSIRDAGRDLYVDPRRRTEFVQQVLTHGRVTEFESQMWRRDGKAVWVSENARVLQRNDGTVSGYEGSVQDISRRKEAEEKLLHNSFFDASTGLPNRQLFLDRLRQLVLRSDESARFAVFSISMDRWRTLSESHSPRFLDDLLGMIADRFEAIQRPGDTISHIGASEFAMLLERLPSLEEVTSFAEHLRVQMAEPIFVDQERIDLSCCVGILYPDSSTSSDPEEILEDARAALAKARSIGHDQQELFNTSDRDLLVGMRQLEIDMRKGIEADQFVPFFQPIISLSTLEVAGFEALVRWKHPLKGLVSPAEFIPLAEETGLIHPIGVAVLTKSCQALLDWGRTNPRAREVFLSVNLSLKQFRHGDLADQLIAILKDLRFPTERLKLEITESAVMLNLDKALEILQRLRGAGIRLAMDDFGTGYSSLSYLSRMPLDTLKIDRAFVCRIGQSGPGEDILRTIATLSHALSMDVVAEGVETTQQAEFLQKIGCEYGQGYLFAKPLPAEEAQELLESSSLPINLRC
jgi:PAS domain S-box-containing protein/diguanylate cyclase (GGDEF)-like protein